MVKQVDDAIEATVRPEMRATKTFYSAHELSRIGRETTKRARNRHRIHQLHIRVHVAAVKTLDALLSFLPKAPRHWIREGLRRQFHRLRELNRQIRFLKSSEQSVRTLLNSSFRALLKISSQVGAEQDVRDVLLI